MFGFLSFIALSVPAVWSWVGVTFYSTRFAIDDLAHRLLMLLQIAATAFMAVSVHDGLGENSNWFALSYAIMRVILIIEYVRTRKHVPDARELITRYSIGFSIVAGIWFVSVFVPLPFRLFLWVVAMGIDIGMPLLFPRRL